MAEQIIQTLGFDASSAIANINLLNTSLSSLNSNLAAVTLSAKAFNQAKLGANLGRIGKGLDNVNTKGANAVNNLTNSVQGLNNRVQDTGKNVTRLQVGFGTLGRVVAVQVLLRSFNALQGAIGGATTETVELQKRVGEIRTIADGALGSFDDITDNLQVTAETFGFDILDLASARYQDLSNQVKGSAENTEFFTASLKLARATNSEVADSVDLISGVLNSFEQDASDAEEVAGTLFRTIDLGRVTATELANNLGTVTPLANSLGISFQELAAIIATITQQGTSASLALTQTRSIMNKLLKPSDALREVFNELEIDSAVEGIQKFGGTVPFLQALREAADGSSEQLAEMFNNVRGLAGLLNTFANEGETVADVLERLSLNAEASVKELNNAFNEVQQTDAVEYEKAVARLNNVFLDIAESSLPLVTGSINIFSDTLEDAATNIDTLLVTLGTTSAAFLLYTSRVRLAVLANSLFGGGIIPLVGSIGLAAGALGAFAVGFIATRAALSAFQDSLVAQQIENYEEAITEANTKTQAFKNTLDEISESSDSLGKDINLLSKALRTINSDTVKGVVEASDDFATAASGSLNDLLKTRQAILKQLESAVEESEDRIAKIRERRLEISNRLESDAFKASIAGFNDVQKAAKLAQEASSIRASAGPFGSEADLEASADQLARSVELAEESLKIAQETGNVAAIGQAQREVESSLRAQIDLQNALEKREEERAAAAKARLADERAATEQLRKTIGQISKLLSITDDQGNLLSPSQRADNKERASELLASLRDQAISSETLSISDLLDITDLTNQFQQQLVEIPAQIVLDQQQFQQEIDKAAKQTSDQIPQEIRDIADRLGITIDELNLDDSLREVFAASKEELNELSKSQLAYTEAVNNSNAAAQALAATLSNDVTRTVGSAGFPALIAEVTGLAEAGREAEATIQSALDNLLRPGQIPLNSEVEEFVDLIRRLNDSGDIDIPGLPGVNEEENLIRLNKALVEFVNLRRKELEASRGADSAGLLQATQDQRLLQSFADAAKDVGLVNTGLGGSVAKTIELKEKTDGTFKVVQNIGTAYDGIVDSLNEAVQAQKNLNSAQAEGQPRMFGGAVTPRMFGGLTSRMFGGNMIRYLQSGGPRGTDNILTALSPGEHVTNARSSNRFAAQLTAMNAGVTPAFREEGGSVTNNLNVGDINVIGNEDPQETARSILAQLRREFRRGTSSRFN